MCVLFPVYFFWRMFSSDNSNSGNDTGFFSCKQTFLSFSLSWTLFLHVKYVPEGWTNLSDLSFRNRSYKSCFLVHSVHIVSLKDILLSWFPSSPYCSLFSIFFVLEFKYLSDPHSVKIMETPWSTDSVFLIYCCVQCA